MPNIFEQEGTGDNQNPVGTHQEQTDAQTGALAELVGEGKKYKTVDDLVASRVAADEHIANLEREAKERSDIIAELQQKVEASGSGVSMEDVQKAIEGSQTGGSNQNPVLDEKSIDALITAKLTQREAAQSAQANITEASNLIAQAVGDVQKGQALVVKRAKELSMTVQDLMNIAAKSPSAFETMMGINQPTSTTTPTSGTLNPDALANAGHGDGPRPGTWAHYSNMRRKNPALYAKPSTQMQMLKDRQAAGEDFYK